MSSKNIAGTHCWSRCSQWWW